MNNDSSVGSSFTNLVNEILFLLIKSNTSYKVLSLAKNTNLLSLLTIKLNSSNNFF